MLRKMVVFSLLPSKQRFLSRVKCVSTAGCCDSRLGLLGLDKAVPLPPQGCDSDSAYLAPRPLSPSLPLHYIPAETCRPCPRSVSPRRARLSGPRGQPSASRRRPCAAVRRSCAPWRGRSRRSSEESRSEDSRGRLSARSTDASPRSKPEDRRRPRPRPRVR